MFLFGVCRLMKPSNQTTSRTAFTAGSESGGQTACDGAEDDAFTDLWYVVVPPLSLLLLQFDGDSSDWTPLDPLHQMRHIPAANSQQTVSKQV